MPGSGLSAIEHVVVLMLENRSFDHMLGFLYSESGNTSPTGQPFEGLTGTESCPDASGQPVTVFKIEPNTPNAYFMPGADPGEGYMATNDQLFGSSSASARSGQAPTAQGFVKNFASTLGWEGHSSRWNVRARHNPQQHHGLLHARDAAGAIRAGPRVRGMRPLVLLGAHRNAAEPGLCQRRDQPGSHGRQDPYIYLPVDLRSAQLTRARLGHLRIHLGAAHQVQLHRHLHGRREPLRSLHRLHGRRRGWDAAAVHVPGAELGIQRQQPAPELRRRARRAADPRRLRGAAQRPWRGHRRC